jgi:membrane protein YqaA with SNARE-associated domain
MEDLALWGLFGSAFISSTLAPGGSEIILANMVSDHDYPVFLLLLIATLGNTLGAFTTWWLGVLAAKKYPAKTLLSDKKRVSLETVKKWGYLALFFSWLPIIGDGFCFAGGWLKMPFLYSATVILIGKALRYSFIAYLFV